jgi:hypothetical protein
MAQATLDASRRLSAALTVPLIVQNFFQLKIQDPQDQPG